jgi:hypothetical protein
MVKTTKNQMAVKKEGRSPSLVKEIEQDLPFKIRKVAELHAVCEQALATSLVAAVQSGELLISLKREVPHGSWESFMKENFPKISMRTLQRYMEIARFVESNPDTLRDFVASANPDLDLSGVSDNDLLRHLTWESAQSLMKLLASQKSAKKESVAIVRSLSIPVLGCIQQTLGDSPYELHSDCSFDAASLSITGEVRSIARKSLQVAGPSALVIAESNPPTSECLESLKRSIRQDQMILVFAPLKHLSERSYAELPHIIFHGVVLFDGAHKGPSDYFVALVGGGEKALSAFKKSSQLLGTLCAPHATQQITGDAALVVVES